MQEGLLIFIHRAESHMIRLLEGANRQSVSAALDIGSFHYAMTVMALKRLCIRRVKRLSASRVLA